MTKVMFFGTEDFSVPTLQKLIEANYKIVAAVTKPDTLRGRGHKLDQPAVKKIAAVNNIKVLQPAKVTEILPEIQKLQPEVGVLVSYGKIIPESIIEAFPKGIINIHPSLLPIYRGPSPIESAILNGDKVTGISIMSLEKAMDAGPVYLQEHIELSGIETKNELYDQFSRQGAKLLIENLPRILDGSIKSTSQDESEATYCQMITKSDGDLDPITMTADECERRIRAFIGWPKTRINLLGKNIIVTKARVLADFSGDKWPDVILCKNNSALEITEIVSPNGKQMKTADYFRGLRQ